MTVAVVILLFGVELSSPAAFSPVSLTMFFPRYSHNRNFVLLKENLILLREWPQAPSSDL